MRVFTTGYLIIMGIISLCLAYRLTIHYRLNQISVKQTSRLFKTKFVQFKQKELRKSLTYLFTGMIAVIIVSTCSIFRLEMSMKDVQANNQKFQSEIQTMKENVAAGPLLKRYPSSGLGLKNSLVSENQTATQKNQLEKSLSNQLNPYIDQANFIFSSANEADYLTLLLTGTVAAKQANLVILGQNISAFVKEIEEIEKISEVQIQINDQKGNNLYKGIYVKDNEGQFRFQPELRKGKG